MLKFIATLIIALLSATSVFAGEAEEQPNAELMKAVVAECGEVSDDIAWIACLDNYAVRRLFAEGRAGEAYSYGLMAMSRRAQMEKEEAARAEEQKAQTDKSVKMIEEAAAKAEKKVEAAGSKAVSRVDATAAAAMKRLNAVAANAKKSAVDAAASAKKSADAASNAMRQWLKKISQN
jgi:hypothetical protein